MPETTLEAALSTTEILLRLLVALACGAVIGLNRDFHNKPAGLRTFGLVALGSALVVIAMDMTPGNDADAVSRVIQGVLTGIGFLGAGVILRRERLAEVAGLTTAAAVWVTAGLGMAAGAGQFRLAGLAMLLALILLVLGGSLQGVTERLVSRLRRNRPKPRDDASPPPPAAGR